MLKRFAILAATLAAVAISLFGAQKAVAANPVHPELGPSAQPTATATPGNDTGHESMPGMSDEEMAGMGHEATAAPSEDTMAGMSDEEMAGMGHDAPATGATQPAGEAGGHGHSGTASTPSSRPIALVVGGFAAVNGAVLVGAGLMRRRDRRLAVRSSKPSRSAK